MAQVIAPDRVQELLPVERATSRVLQHDHDERPRAPGKLTSQPVACAVAHPCDATALQDALETAKVGIIWPILVRPLAKIRTATEKAASALAGFEPVATTT